MQDPQHPKPIGFKVVEVIYHRMIWGVPLFQGTSIDNLFPLELPHHYFSGEVKEEWTTAYEDMSLYGYEDYSWQGQHLGEDKNLLDCHRFSKGKWLDFSGILW